MITTFEPPLPIRWSTCKKTKPQPRPSLEEILADVCDFFGADINMVIAASGTKNVKKDDLVKCRRIYCYVANVLTNHTQDAIAKVLNRDRTTCLNLLNQASDWFNVNEERFINDWNAYASNSDVWKVYYNLKLKSYGKYGQPLAAIN